MVLAPRALAEALAMQMGEGGQQARRELEAIRRQYQLPPFNVQVDFTIYGKREKAVLDFAEEMYGQLEFSQRVLDWQQSRVLQRGRDEGFILRGRVTLDRFSAGAFTELRRRGKGKRLDLILAPQYY